jgi:membrane glycosyltransferase
MEIASVHEYPGMERTVFARRVFFAALVLSTIAALFVLATYALSAGGLTFTDGLLLLFYALTMPWAVIGFWNGIIGFVIMRLARDPVAAVNPSAAHGRRDEPILVSTALTIFVRNEPPHRVIRNLGTMMRDLTAAGAADKFHLYVLSDTSLPEIMALEEQSFTALAEEWRGRIPVTYRRREINTGFKAGILQGLVAGLPTTSAFARIFQFGMRLGMQSFTIGSAWWQADCGPYWGHNAALRIAPFKTYCEIPVLPGKGVLRGHVLSHDQIEAALMRRAGYDVRVLPEEDLGWEENPPTLIEFIRRDLRWLQGTLQYGFFLALPKLKFVSRFQLAFAMMMFLGSPAWMGLLVVGTIAIATSPTMADFIRADAGYALLAVQVVMWFTPKIASAIDVLTRPKIRRAFGGAATFLLSLAIETCSTFLLSPIMWFGHTMFFAGLPFGRVIGWIGQVRDDHTVPWSVAFKQLWPHTTLGIACLALLAATHPIAAIYAFALIAGGLAISIPFAVITAKPSVGLALARVGIGRLPEESAPPTALAALSLPALAASARAA